MLRFTSFGSFVWSYTGRRTWCPCGHSRDNGMPYALTNIGSIHTDVTGNYHYVPQAPCLPILVYEADPRRHSQDDMIRQCAKNTSTSGDRQDAKFCSKAAHLRAILYDLCDSSLLPKRVPVCHCFLRTLPASADPVATTVIPRCHDRSPTARRPTVTCRSATAQKIASEFMIANLTRFTAKIFRRLALP